MPDYDMGTAGDAEMMEAEKPAPAPSSSGEGIGADRMRNLLALARQLIDQGKPSQALQAVVTTVKIRGGDEAVFHALNRAREQYIARLHATTAADELASLFAECVIAEALPSGPLPPHQHKRADLPVESDAQGTSILAETGAGESKYQASPAVLLARSIRISNIAPLF